jgi:hypothetical protein
MRKIAFILSILFATNSPNLPHLNLGDKVPADAIKMNKLVMVSPAQLQPMWLWNYGGVEYTLGVDEDKFVQFISTSSVHVSTLEGIRVGKRWGDLVDVPGVRFEEWRGWGKVAVLPSGWMAACYSELKLSGSVEPKDDQVDELFKGTAAGFGQRPSNRSQVKSDRDAEAPKIKKQSGSPKHSLCDLQEQVTQGEHRLVRVEGVYLTGLAGTYLVIPECSSHSTYIDFKFKKQRNREKLVNLISANLEKGVRGDGTPVLVIFEGDFTGPPVPDQKLPEWLRKIYHPGWDRNAMTKLTVYSIRSVKSLPAGHPCAPSALKKMPCFQRDAISPPSDSEDEGTDDTNSESP